MAARRGIERIGMAGATLALVLSAPALAQYREYYVRGKVVDIGKQPIAGVEIELHDVATSRRFNMKTGKDGTFKFAGLPHGIYKASFAKDGYAPRQDEWKLEAPQDSMQRVEIPDVVLASRDQLAAFEKALELDPSNADAAYNAGLILFETNRIEEALRHFEQGLASKPEDPDLLEMAGRCYIHQAKLERALESLQKARGATADAAKAAFLDELIAKLKAGK